MQLGRLSGLLWQCSKYGSEPVASSIGRTSVVSVAEQRLKYCHAPRAIAALAVVCSTVSGAHAGQPATPVPPNCLKPNCRMG